jgi:YHS domain-containing protein
MRYARLAILMLGCIFLQACGTLYATALNAQGQDVMLLGYDPVAYFTEGKPLRGNKAFQHSLDHPPRTYYFSNDRHKQIFIAEPARFEPQYGGFCSSGAAYRIKLGSDPTEFEILNGRLFIFGDILGKEMWRVFRDEHVRYADQVWPQIKDQGWRRVSLASYANKVPWYRDSKTLHNEFQRQNPGKTLSYNPGGMFTNLFLKGPGWRAAEGFGQPALGWPD